MAASCLQPSCLPAGWLAGSANVASDGLCTTISKVVHESHNNCTKIMNAFPVEASYKWLESTEFVQVLRIKSTLIQQNYTHGTCKWLATGRLREVWVLHVLCKVARTMHNLCATLHCAVLRKSLLLPLMIVSRYTIGLGVILHVMQTQGPRPLLTRNRGFCKVFAYMRRKEKRCVLLPTQITKMLRKKSLAMVLFT